MKQILFPVLLLCTLLTGGCKEEEYVYPSVLTEFISVQTDESGTIARLVADNGTTYAVLQREGLDGLKADTLYRSLSIYEPVTIDATEAVSAQLYSCQLVPSPYPLPASAFKNGVKTDPVDIQSIWFSGDYLNMILLVQYKEIPHLYHFVDEGITGNTDGSHTLNLRLYHNRNNDYEAFTQKIPLSIPLDKHLKELKAGDTIRFYLHTYKEGETYREFYIQ